MHYLLQNNQQKIENSTKSKFGLNGLRQASLKSQLPYLHKRIFKENHLNL